VNNSLKIDLDSFDIFSSLDTSNQDKLKALLRPRSFRKNEVIFFKGDPGNGLYIIHRGRVKICVFDCQGNELIFTFLTKGDLLGDMAIIDGKPRSASAIAIEETDTIFLDRQEFERFLSSSPQACLGIINMLCQRLRRLSVQLEEISFLDVAGRISRKMMSLAKNEPSTTGEKAVCSITQEELAIIVGASREMVNKILNSFVDMNLISISRQKLTILDQHQLNRIATYDEDSQHDIAAR
jgi:CRP/FNR family transcriptional regulator, cyclic AMP receptor protein